MALTKENLIKLGAGLLALAVAWGGLVYSVRSHDRQIVGNRTRINDHQTRLTTVEIKYAADIEHIKGGMADQRCDLKEMKSSQDDIKEAVMEIRARMPER